MANLSAYIDFHVKINFNLKKIEVSLVGETPLPGGITDLDVTAKIRQPDCSTRDLTLNVSSIYPLVSSGEKKLLMTSEGKPQKGKYKITVTIKADGYDDTVIEKEFVLRYERPVATIEKAFDLLSPSLKFKDETVYSVPGLYTLITVRAWEIQVGTVGVLSIGNLPEADLKYSDNYYDAVYSGRLTANVSYSSDDYSYLTVEDVVTGEIEARANTVPPYRDFPDMLMFIKENSSESGCSNCESADFKTAYTLFKAITGRICDPVTTALMTSIEKFLAIYYKYAGAYVNTNAIISPYDRSFCNAPTGDNIYILNTTVQQKGANINIDGSVSAEGTPHAVGEVTKFLVFHNNTFMYLTAGELSAALGGVTPGSHNHDISDVVGLEEELSKKLEKNSYIEGATKTKITYDSKGLVIDGADLEESDIPALSIAKISNLQESLDSKAAVDHNHEISDVDNLTESLAAKANDSAVVHITGNETINGVKNFLVSPLVPTPTNKAHAVNKEYVDSLVGSATGLNPIKITLSGDSTYNIPAGSRFFGMVITPSGQITLKVGLTPNGDEVMPEETIDSGADKDVNMAIIARTAKTLYFTGVTASTDVLIYLMTLTPLNP